MIRKTFLLLVLVGSAIIGSTQIYSGEDQSRFQTAKEKFRSGNYELSAEICTQILDRVRESQVYQLRANSHIALGELEKAEYDLTEALQTGKRDSRLYFERGKLRMAMKKFDRAELDFVDASRVFKDETNSNVEMFPYLEEMGRAQQYRGLYKNAIETYKSAIGAGSTLSVIDLISTYLQAGYLSDLRLLYDSVVLRGNLPYGDDIVYYNYLQSVGSIINEKEDVNSIAAINKAIKAYSVVPRFGFNGFLNDLMYAKYKLHLLNNQDTLAYRTLKQVHAFNSVEKTKEELSQLRARLNMDGTPPVIDIINPRPDRNSVIRINDTNDKLELYGYVRDSSRITELTINRKPVYEIENDGLFIQTLELHPGRNLFTIAASDVEDNESEVKLVVYFEEKSQASESPYLVDEMIPELDDETTNHAILIAAKNYVDPAFTDLTAPINDVKDLSALLTSLYEFEEKNIHMIINQNKDTILSKISQTLGNLTDNDNVLIFYAGHGDVKKKDETVIGGYLIPSDAKMSDMSTYISSNELLTPALNSNARHILYVLDACFGGSFLRSAMNNAPQHIKNLYMLKSRNILTSGNIEEVPDQGKFIQNIKDFLRTNPKKFVSSLELFTYIVTNNENSNTPQLGQIKGSGDTGGKFIFVKKESQK